MMWLWIVPLAMAVVIVGVAWRRDIDHSPGLPLPKSFCWLDDYDEFSEEKSR